MLQKEAAMTRRNKLEKHITTGGINAITSAIPV
jgi:hypothetical protein